MSKLFMQGISFEGIEQLMVMVPNFHSRRSGIVINNYFNCEAGAKDCNDNVINVSKGWINVDILVQVLKLMWIDIDTKIL